jgi:hypothetical protein
LVDTAVFIGLLDPPADLIGPLTKLLWLALLLVLVPLLPLQSFELKLPDPRILPTWSMVTHILFMEEYVLFFGQDSPNFVHFAD